MQQLVPVIRDFSIAVVIAIFTTDKLGLSIIAYKAVIFTLILAVIFVALWKLDRYSRRLEILSVSYCDNFIRKVLDQSRVKDASGNDREVSKIKLFNILPSSIEELESIGKSLRRLQRFTLGSQRQARELNVFGKIGADNQLLFDTPIGWSSGITFLATNKNLSKTRIQNLIRGMNRDIRQYAKMALKDHPGYEHLGFIKLNQFELYFS